MEYCLIMKTCRGETFVTRKIAKFNQYPLGLESCLFLGNIGALRDWGHAKDYVRMQWMMTARGVSRLCHCLWKATYCKEFIQWSANALSPALEFSGQGVDEIATVVKINGDKSPGVEIGQVVVRIDPRYFRPAEVETLLGDPSEAKNLLGWEPEISVQEMCNEMVQEDYRESLRHKLLMENGFQVPLPLEG